MPYSHEHIHKLTLTHTYIRINTECPKIKPVFENEIYIECYKISHYHSHHVPNRSLITVCLLVQCVITEGDRQSLFKFVAFTHHL